MKSEILDYVMGEKMQKELLANKGTLFENLYIYVTNSCNMFCTHCYLGNRLVERQEMPLSDVIAHLKFWRELGSSKICFLGGEPTLYPFLREAVDYAHELNYKKVLINTNLSETAYSVISNYSVSDFTYIQTSLDGVNEETHEKIRGKGTFSETVNSIRQLTKRDYDIRIIMTVNNYNISEMIPMVELSENLGASLVKFHIMSEIGNADRGMKLGLTPKVWHNACNQLKYYAMNRKDRNIKISFQPAYSDFQSQDDYVQHGYKGCVGKFKERMSVFPDGKCYICSFLFDFDDSFAELKNGIIEITDESVEKNFVTDQCASCTKCQFDGCIAEEIIYGGRVCNKDALFPVCRLWKIQF